MTGYRVEVRSKHGTDWRPLVGGDLHPDFVAAHDEMLTMQERHRDGGWLYRVVAS